jgi:hypothetical protein
MTVLWYLPRVLSEWLVRVKGGGGLLSEVMRRLCVVRTGDPQPEARAKLYANKRIGTSKGGLHTTQEGSNGQNCVARYNWLLTNVQKDYLSLRSWGP